MIGPQRAVARFDVVAVAGRVGREPLFVRQGAVRANSVARSDGVWGAMRESMTNRRICGPVGQSRLSRQKGEERIRGESRRDGFADVLP